MSQQHIMQASEGFTELDEYFSSIKVDKILLVCGGSIKYLRVNEYFEALALRLGIQVFRFSDFSPNPTYDSVLAGLACYKENACQAIVAVGGGSAMDLAKCIKLFANMDSTAGEFINQKIAPNDIPLLAIPTTAGTGSEATRYAVIYYKGEKQSITDESCIPQAVLFDASCLKNLPLYQKKATMLDALCHAIESYWSVHSNDESKIFARQAIEMVLANKDAYLANDDAGNAKMLQAAYLAGKAINITATTAGHAMAYKLTSLYGIAHGHAVALCINVLWPYMLKHMDDCIDQRGKEYLEQVMTQIADIVGGDSAYAGYEVFRDLFSELELEIPEFKDNDIQILSASVNITRLKNHPIALASESIEKLYADMHVGKK